MKAKYYLLLFIILAACAALSYRLSYSYFSDRGYSNGNIFGASTSFPTTPTPTVTPIVLADHIVINEVNTIEPDNKDWVELYNPTSSSVSMSNWKVCDNSTSCDTFTFTIPAGNYAVIVSSNYNGLTVPTGKIIKLNDNKIGGDGLNDPGDRVIIKDASNNEIDKMSYGTDSTAFPSPPTAPISGKTISRIPNGVDTNTSSDWVTNTNPTIGNPN